MVKVKFEIVDINDHSPTFHKPQLHVVASEAAVVGTTLAIIAKATDMDSPFYGVKKYQLKNNHHALFSLQVADKVLIKLNGVLNREASSTYSIALLAFDGGSPSNSGVMVIKLKVTDENDNHPRFINLPGELQVPENQVLMDFLWLETLDADEGVNAQVEVRIEDSNLQPFDSFFSLDRDTGLLSIISPLDYESTYQIILVLVAADKGNPRLSSSINLNITVKDINDNSPYIQPLPWSSSSFIATSPLGSKYFEREISENCAAGSVVTSLHVTDEDSGMGGEVMCRVDFFDYRLQNVYE